MIRICNVRDCEDTGTARRILVDRLWPRGISRENLQPDEWMREVAPSTELRKWFSHEPGRYAEFRTRYREELMKSGSFRELLEMSRSRDLVLLYAARDREHNNAVVLMELLDEESV